MIHTAKVLTNCSSTLTGMSFTRAVATMNTRASTQPRSTPPPQVRSSVGTRLHPESAPVIAAPTAKR